MALTEKEQQKIERNEIEDKLLQKSIDDLLNKKLRSNDVIKIGTTPFCLRVAGAGVMPLIISQGDLRNCMENQAVSNQIKKKHSEPHDIPIATVKEFSKALRNPVCICKGNIPNTLLVISDLLNKNNENIVFPIHLSVNGVKCKINKIESAYGKKNIQDFLLKMYLQNKILAVNKEKIDKCFMTQSNIGRQLPKFEAFTNYDNSIAYSTANVKYITENSQNISSEKENAPSGDEERRGLIIETVIELSEAEKAKIKQNEQEEALFRKNLHSLINGDKRLASRPLVIGKTPNIFAVCDKNVNADNDLVITKKVIEKCMRPELRDGNGKRLKNSGHYLAEEQLAKALENLKEPVMVLKGSLDNTFVAVTDFKDDKDKEIIIAIEINKSVEFGEVNKISSAYGKNNFSTYIKENIQNNNLIAVNIEKANKMLHSIGVDFPEENTFISFDNSIAYSTANVKYITENSQSISSEKENVPSGDEERRGLIIETVIELSEVEKEKIKQNEQEEALFRKNLHSLINGDKRLASRPLVIGKTTNILAACGADKNLPLTITKKVIDKAMRPEIRDENGNLIGKTGHDLSEKQLIDSLSELKNPAMVLKSKGNSIVVVTTLTDNKNRNIIVPIDLSVKEGRIIVNSIRSSYGRNNFSLFIEKNYNDGNILAINKEKANEIFQSIGKWYPKEETFISFDNSIAYSTANVKYITENSQSISSEKENVPSDDGGKEMNLLSVEITQADIDVLRTLEPRKSILNFTEAEFAATKKWAEKFQGELSEKSTFYRLTNGDWRENDENRVPIIDVDDKSPTFQSVREDIKQQVIFRGSVVNSDTDWNIQISRKGLEDTVKYAFNSKNYNAYNLLYNIEDIIKNGVLLDSVICEKNNKSKSFNPAFMHKMYATCRLNENTFLAKLTIEEFFDGKENTLKRLYNVQDIKIEPLRHIEFTEKPLARSVLSSSSEPSRYVSFTDKQPHLKILNGSDISISDLFKLVKSFDKDFYLNKRSEKQIERLPTGDTERNDNMDEQNLLLERIAALEKQVAAMTAEQQNLKEQINTVNMIEKNTEKENYSVFFIDNGIETAYYRDDNTDINALVQRIADSDLSYPEISKNCTRISELAFTELDQMGDPPPAFCAEINLKTQDIIGHEKPMELTVWDNDKIATINLDEAIQSLKENGTVSLDYHNFSEDNDTVELESEYLDFSERLDNAYDEFMYRNGIFNNEHIAFVNEHGQLPYDLNTAENRDKVIEYINIQLEKGSNLSDRQKDELSELKNMISEIKEMETNLDVSESDLSFIAETKNIKSYTNEAQEKFSERSAELDEQNRNNNAEI